MPSQDRSTHSDRWRVAGIAAALVALVLAVYSVTFDDPWHYDDRAELAWPGVRQFDPDTRVTAYRGAVVLWSWAANYRWSGEDPRGYHMVNVAIHALCTLALFFLVERLGRLARSGRPPFRWSVAALAAALFACHPLATQSVAYVTQRSTSIATLFLLLTLWAWTVARCAGTARARTAAFLAALAAYQLGVHSKPVALVAPVVIVAIEGVAAARLPRRRFLLVLGAFAALALLRFRDFAQPLTVRLSRSHDLPPNLGIASQETAALGPLDYVATQLRVIVGYLRLLVCPVGQTVDPLVPPSHSFLDPAVIASAALLLALGAAVWRWRHRVPLAWIGTALFAAALIPTSTFVPGRDLAAEHRVYAPLAGFAIAVAATFGMAARRFGPARIAALAAMVLAALTATTMHRLRVWDSEEALWWDALDKAPEAPRARLNLAAALERQGRLDEAERHYRELLRRDPSNPSPLNNLGNVMRSRGRIDEAVALYERARDEAPGDVQPLLNLGSIALARGDPSRADSLLRQAVRMEPDEFLAWYNLAKVAEARADWTEAIRLYEGAIDLRPAEAQAWNDLGGAFLQAGDPSSAVRPLTEAARLSPGWSVPRYNLALAREADGDGDVEGAIRELRAALERQPPLDLAAERLARLAAGR